MALTGFGLAGFDLLDGAPAVQPALAAQLKRLSLPIPPLVDAGLNDGKLALTVISWDQLSG